MSEIEPIMPARDQVDDPDTNSEHVHDSERDHEYEHEYGYEQDQEDDCDCGNGSASEGCSSSDISTTTNTGTSILDQYSGQDWHVVNELINRYGEEEVKQMDLSVFTGPYVHSLIGCLYPRSWHEPEPPPSPPPNYASTLEPEVFALLNRRNPGPRSGRRPNASSARRSNRPLNGAITKRRRSRRARGSGNNESTESEGNSAEAENRSSNDAANDDDLDDDENMDECDEKAQDTGGSGSGNSGGSGSSSGAGAVGAINENDMDNNEELPEPDVVWRAGKKPTVKNVSEYFKKHPHLKGYYTCKKCKDTVWPPNRQKHAVKCLEIITES